MSIEVSCAIGDSFFAASMDNGGDYRVYKYVVSDQRVIVQRGQDGSFEMIEQVKDQTISQWGTIGEDVFLSPVEALQHAISKV